MYYRVVVTFFFLLIWNNSAAAWESDLHFGLTRWLALQAGFTEDAANTIAWGDQGLDYGVRAAPKMVGLYACRGDYGASRDVRNNHFPTIIDPPAPPERRIVTPGGPAALERAHDEAIRQVEASFSYAQQRSLTNFGEGLHALQDSWSHNGIPDVPFFCNRDLAWAHPVARGGWASHAADLTYIWVNDTLASAEATYNQMLDYLKHHSWASQKAPASWQSLSQDVVRFASAKTKTDKQEWFALHGFKNLEFLDGITLPGGRTRFLDFVLERLFAQPPEAIARAQLPDDVRTFFTGLFSVWMTSDNFDELLGKVDPERFVKSMELTSFGEPMAVTLTALLAWRVRDHGLVAGLGHASPKRGQEVFEGLSSNEAFEMLRRLTQNPEARIKYESLNKAMIPFGEERFVVVPTGTEGYAAFAQFTHTPYDMVMVEVERVQGLWRVVSLNWMIEH